MLAVLTQMIANYNKSKPATDQELRRWAEIEYPMDAEYAYHEFKTAGRPPRLVDYK